MPLERSGAGDRSSRSKVLVHLIFIAFIVAVVVYGAFPFADSVGPSDPSSNVGADSLAANLAASSQDLGQPTSSIIPPVPSPTPEPAATRGPCERPAETALYCRYTVQPGDTLWAIARDFGLEGGPLFGGSDILALNNDLDISESSLLQSGARLRVTYESAIIHAVQPAETLSEIAERYGVTVAEIQRLTPNGISASSFIQAGQDLLVPAVTSSVTVAAIRVADKKRVESEERERSKGLAALANTDRREDASDDDDSQTDAINVLPSHIVSLSETLEGIALHYGVGVESIVEANNIDPLVDLAEGQNLLIPRLSSTDGTQAAEAIDRSTESDAATAAAEGEEEATASLEASAPLTKDDSSLSEDSSSEAKGSGEEPATDGTASSTSETSDSVETTARSEDSAASEETTPSETPPATVEATAIVEGTATPAPSATPRSPPDEVRRRSTPAARSTPLPPTAVATPPTTTDILKVQEEFAAGYRAAGGPEAQLQHILQRVMRCESGYRIYAHNPVGPFYGLMQFLPATWTVAGGGDWYSAWQQGANTASLLKLRNPLTQWPVCWLN